MIHNFWCLRWERRRLFWDILGSLKPIQKLTGENRSSLGGKKPPRSIFTKLCSKFNVKSKKIFTTLTMNLLSPLYKENQETNMNLPTNGLKDNSIHLLSNPLLLKKS